MTVRDTSILRTPLCETLDIDVPIISAGMGPIAGPDLVAAVSNAGGLGVLGCTSMTSDEMRMVIRRTRELTDRPFGVDLILPARLEQTGVRASDVAERIPSEHWAVARRIADELGVESPACREWRPAERARHRRRGAGRSCARGAGAGVRRRARNARRVRVEAARRRDRRDVGCRLHQAGDPGRP